MLPPTSDPSLPQRISRTSGTFSLAGALAPVHFGYVCWRSAGDVVSPAGSVLPLKQLVGLPLKKLNVAMSPFVA